MAFRPCSLLLSSIAIHIRDDHRYGRGAVSSEIEGFVEQGFNRKERRDFLWESSIRVGFGEGLRLFVMCLLVGKKLKIKSKPKYCALTLHVNASTFTSQFIPSLPSQVHT